MKLQTKIPLLKESNNLLDYNSNVLLLGSCFVENIGKKLSYFKFQNLQNPFGILFQPKAIETLISNAVNQKKYTEKDIFFQNEHWYCFDAHSKLSTSNKENLIQVLNHQIQLTTLQLQNATHIILTLGTAWVYRHIETNKLVANCHKIPQKQFKKEILSVDEISESLENIYSLIKSINQEAHIILTVSPVRHIKDGFIENTRSKAHLITAMHQVINQKSVIVNRNSSYFPSYEIMMDELRDYRFYDDDMLHPNKTAIQYIWEKFQDVWISENALKTMEAVDAVQKGLQHKPFNPNSEANQNFIQKLEYKKKELQTQFKHIYF